MKAILLIRPRSTKPHREEDIASLGFTPYATPKGLWYGLQLFPRKIEAVVKLHDLATEHGIPCRADAPLIWIGDVRIELHAGHKALHTMASFQLFHPEPLISKYYRTPEKRRK